MFGPVSGRRHDSYIVNNTNIIPLLHNLFGEDEWFVYGDSAFPITPILRKIIRNPVEESDIERNNCMMCSRVTIEWLFGYVARNWAFVDFKKNLKLFLSPVDPLAPFKKENASITQIASQAFEKFIPSSAKSFCNDKVAKYFDLTPKVQMEIFYDKLEQYDNLITFDINKCYRANLENRDEDFYFITPVCSLQ